MMAVVLSTTEWTTFSGTSFPPKEPPRGTHKIDAGDHHNEEDEAVKRNSKKKATRGVSTRSEKATIEEEDHATFTRLSNRQRKRSGRKEMR